MKTMRFVIAFLIAAVAATAVIGSIVLVSFDQVSAAISEAVQKAIQSANEQPGTGYVRDPRK